MPDEFKVPKFKNESEEARWWDSYGENITRAFERAAAGGQLARGSAKRKGAAPTTTIRLDQEDIARARVQAECKGLRYQTYLQDAAQRGAIEGREKNWLTAAG